MKVHLTSVLDVNRTLTIYSVICTIIAKSSSIPKEGTFRVGIVIYEGAHTYTNKYKNKDASCNIDSTLGLGMKWD